MKIKKKMVQILFGASMVFGVVVSIKGAVVSAQCDKVIAQDDAFQEWYASVVTEAHNDTQLYVPEYSWKEQQIAKIVGFEVGNTGCPVCLHYVASACINRMNYWYNGDPIAMVRDGNDQYYYMNPEYAEYGCIEVNGWNYYEHAEEALKVVKEAERNTADIWYWDCADTQRDWADLVYRCPQDNMYFYK